MPTCLVHSVASAVASTHLRGAIFEIFVRLSNKIPAIHYRSPFVLLLPFVVNDYNLRLNTRKCAFHWELPFTRRNFRLEKYTAVGRRNMAVFLNYNNLVTVQFSVSTRNRPLS